MIYQSVSGKVILGRIATKFRFQSADWLANAPIWLFEAIEALGNYNQLVKTSKELTSSSFRAEMPCNLVAIYAIEYNGHRLPYSGDLTHFNQYCYPRTTSPIPADGTVVDIITGLSIGAENVVNSNLYGPSRYGGIEGNSYQINPGYIITSFESGKIKVHFSVYPVGEDGWPTVPDNYYTKEAMQWYIVSCILLGGVEHSVITYEYANSMWEKFVVQARNYNAYPSIDQVDKLKRTWVRMIPPDYTSDDFFIGIENNEKIITR